MGSVLNDTKLFEYMSKFGEVRSIKPVENVAS